MVVDYINTIPIWVNSDNKRYNLSGITFTRDTSNFSNAQFIGLDTMIITRTTTNNDNIYLKIDSNGGIRQNINQSLKVDVSYWYTINTEAVANGTYVYTFKLDMWATYCMNLLNEKRDLPLLHRRSHLHTTNSKFAEDELFNSVQKTVIGNKIFGRNILTSWYSAPRELLIDSASLEGGTSGAPIPQTNSSSNDIYYVFRDKASGGYRCYPLLEFKVNVENTTAPNFKSAFSMSYVCAINVYDESDNLNTFYRGDTALPNNKIALAYLFSNSNDYNWYDRRAESYYTYYYQYVPKSTFNSYYNGSPSTFKKSNVYFFIQNGETRDIDIETNSAFAKNFNLYQNAAKFKFPIRNYDDVVLNVRKRGEFEILEYSLHGHVIYKRQILNTNSWSWTSYIKYAWILISWTKIPGTTLERLEWNRAKYLNALINHVDYINDFVGIYKWVPYNMLNDDNYNLTTVNVSNTQCKFIWYLLDKNGTYVNAQHYLDGGYMDMFIDRARIPRLNVKRYVMSWNSRVAMETKWWNNIIDPRVHFGTYGNNQEKTSIGIFGYFTFNESGFKWTKTSNYAFSENISMQLSGALVSATSEYKQYISSQLSTLETGYNLQKEQTNLDISRNNFNSAFNAMSSMTSAVVAPFQAFGKLITGDVGGAMGSMGSGINAQLDFYRNIGNTIYNNKQANLDLKKVKDTTIAAVSDRFRSSTNIMTQSSIKDIVLSSATLYPAGIWFHQQVLADSTIMGYNNINVMYGFVNNEYLKLLDTIYKSDTETKLSWIELDEEDVRVKLSQYFNQNIPYQFHEEMFKILTTGFRIWSGSYTNYGNWIYDN